MNNKPKDAGLHDPGNWSVAANSSAGSKGTTFFKDIYSDLSVPASWSNITLEFQKYFFIKTV